MEFNEKLQELRKSRSLTQEELAEALFVSRTAISKWESGRGYPSLDSLKEISKFFSVSIDDLICSEEIISAAEDEKKDCMDKYISLICDTLDIFLVLLLFLPVFGNGTDNPASVSLYAITGLSTWIKIVFTVLVSITILNGICGVIICHFEKPVWNRHRLVTGMVLSVACAAVFILTRQPYAGIICLAILVVKGLLIGKGKKFDMIKNERIRIYPASREQMEKCIDSETDEELKKAYSEMLEGCLAHHEEWDWYAMWMIEKMDGTHIGDFCFKGIGAGHNPEIGYGILDEFQGLGYATEAVKLALKWAFNHPEVVAVEAESDPDNAASQRVLEKCGFLATGEIGEEGPRFIFYKGANRPVDGAGCPVDIRSARTETECRCSAPTEVERRNNKQ